MNSVTSTSPNREYNVCHCLCYTGLFVYGLGPNTFIGVPAALYFGGEALIDKIKKIYLERSLNNEHLDDEEILVSRLKIRKLDKLIDEELILSRFALISAVPIAGPTILYEMLK